MTLHELGVKYLTDKSAHGYLPHYERHLKNIEVKSLLEIGCKQGASLRMWREYFPNAMLHTLDLFEEFEPPTDILGLHAVKGDQTDSEILQHLSQWEYSVCIDDGSHNSHDQWVSFLALWPVCNGMYVVEDLHCCNEAFYRQGLTFEETMLGQMQTGTFDYNFKLYDGKIAFIFK